MKRYVSWVILLSNHPCKERIMESRKTQDSQHKQEHLLDAHPAIVLAVLLIVATLTFGDTMEIIPAFNSFVASPIFPYFHESHDLIALGLIMYATFKYNIRLGLVSALIYTAAHIPYFVLRFSEDTPEITRIIIGIFIVFFAIWMKRRLNDVELQKRKNQETLNKMQEKLIEQDKLSSIGRLMAGVAHEMNNPLTSIIGFSQLLFEKDLPNDVKDDLKIINDEANRTANIVKGLLTFARKQPEKKEPTNVNTQVQRVLELNKRRFLSNNICVNINLADGLPHIIGNGPQLQQVLFNLVGNAEQIMMETRGKGTLTIATEQLDDLVKISVTDDGPGISPENMKKLFTPFFTTKEVGKGTGLGLSICQSIITEHGGNIYAESKLGLGTTFIIELPISQNKEI